MASSLSAAFTAIANAIRAKKGVSTTYTPDEMPDAISSIATATLQTKTTNVTPSANWSGTNTNTVAITPDSGYDGMSQVNVSVPMLRDYTLMTADTVDTPSTVYSGNTSQSNSQKLLRMKPTKDGMSYTGSYLYMQPNSYLGNASASDVLSGKTFSSSNGIQITGTGSGGTTPTGTKYDTYSSNGTYTTDVSNYANHSVTVNVSGTTPSGTKYDTYRAYGTYTEDVTNYASHSVTVYTTKQDTFTPSTSSTTYINLGSMPTMVFCVYRNSNLSGNCAWSVLTSASDKTIYFCSLVGSTKTVLRTTSTSQSNCIASLDSTGFTFNKVTSTFSGTWMYIATM